MLLLFALSVYASAFFVADALGDVPSVYSLYV